MESVIRNAFEEVFPNRNFAIPMANDENIRLFQEVLIFFVRFIDKKLWIFMIF